MNSKQRSPHIILAFVAAMALIYFSLSEGYAAGAVMVGFLFGALWMLVLDYNRDHRTD